MRTGGSSRLEHQTTQMPTHPSMTTTDNAKAALASLHLAPIRNDSTILPYADETILRRARDTSSFVDYHRTPNSLCRDHYYGHLRYAFLSPLSIPYYIYY